MSPYKKFTKHVGLVTIVNFLVVIKAIIFLPLITKLLGAFDYGIWAQLLITVGLFAPIVRLGLTNSIVRYVAGEKNKEEIKEGVYSTLVLISLLSMVVLILFLALIKPISQFFQAPPILIGILPFIILFECLNTTLLSTFQALLQMKKYSFFMIVLSLSEILFVVSSIAGGYGLSGAVFSLLLAKALVFSMIFLHTYKTIGFAFPKFHLFKKYLSFGIPTLLSNVSYLAVTSIDKYLIGFFLGTLFVGYYAPAYSLGNFITFLIIPISFVLFPAVSRSYDEHKVHEVRTKLRYSVKYFLLVAIPAVCGISVLIRQILAIFTTPEIAANAFFITPLIASSILFYGMSDIFSLILTLVKKTSIVGYVWIASAIVNVLLNLILIPRIGILGAALATLAAYLFSFVLIWHYSFKELTFEIDWIAIAKIVFCSLGMSFVVWLINPQGLAATILTVMIGVIVYGILVAATRTLVTKEMNFLKDLLSRPTSSPANT